MKNIYLTIGHNVGNTPKYTTPYICERVAKYLELEAFTAIPCFGMWQGSAEQSTRIEINALTEDQAAQIESLIPQLAKALKQNAIMFEIQESKTAFIGYQETQQMTA